MQFLVEAKLVQRVEGRGPVITLSGADLSGARKEPLLVGDLRGVILSDADLSSADLRGANLSNADLSGADLSGGVSENTIFFAADLSGADLSGADLGHGGGISPNGADLGDTDLSDAVFSDADLRGAGGVTNEELEEQAASLEGATKPNGQKYEEWIKDKEGSSEDGNDSGGS